MGVKMGVKEGVKEEVKEGVKRGVKMEEIKEKRNVKDVMFFGEKFAYKLPFSYLCTRFISTTMGERPFNRLQAVLVGNLKTDRWRFN